jgi:hypothetical protein
VVVGPIDTRNVLTATLPKVTTTLCRLHANRDQFAERIARRGRGLGPPIPGDERAGQPASVRRRVADRAARDAQRLDHDALGDLVVGTDEKSPPDMAKEILHRTDWMNFAAPIHRSRPTHADG